MKRTVSGTIPARIEKARLTLSEDPARPLRGRFLKRILLITLVSAAAVVLISVAAGIAVLDIGTAAGDLFCFSWRKYNGRRKGPRETMVVGG